MPGQQVRKAGGGLFQKCAYRWRLLPWLSSPQSIPQKLSGKYPKVQELLLGKRARCYLLPAPERQWSSKGQASPKSSKCSRGGDLSGIASQTWPSLSLAQAPQSEESLFQTQKMTSLTSSGPTSQMC